MKQFKILVAYDGSPHSKSALDWALHLGVKTGAEIAVVKVFEPIARTYTRGDYHISEEIAGQYAEMEQTDKRMMEDVKAFCQTSCPYVHTEIIKGHVATALLDYARRNGVNLIVAGTKGHGVLKEMLVGSVTASLIKLSEAPVLIVDELNGKLELKKMLVAYDGSPHSKKALKWAIELSRSTGAAVMAVKVFEAIELTMLEEFGSSPKLAGKLAELNEVDRQLLEEVADCGKEQGVEIITQALDGNKVATIINYAETYGVDMIVAGTKGHGTLVGMLVGSVAQGLVSLSKIPVLIVK